MISILLFLSAAQAELRIASEAIDPERFRLSMTGSIASVTEAQSALRPTARRLCDSRPVSFGTFRLSQAETVKAAGTAKPAAERSLEQEVFCGTPNNNGMKAAAALPADWQPSDIDQRAVLAATYAFFAAKDAGRYSEAWSMLSPQMQKISPAAQWRGEAGNFNRRAGPVRARRVTEITWYKNPPDAPQPGLYVAADYSADFEQLDFVCGYVMWRLQPDGSFVLTREEQNIFDKARAKNLASIDRAPLRAQMGCKD